MISAGTLTKIKKKNINRKGALGIMDTCDKLYGIEGLFFGDEPTNTHRRATTARLENGSTGTLERRPWKKKKKKKKKKNGDDGR